LVVFRKRGPAGKRGRSERRRKSGKQIGDKSDLSIEKKVPTFAKEGKGQVRRAAEKSRGLFVKGDVNNRQAVRGI